jgi:hypothetical protein
MPANKPTEKFVKFKGLRNADAPEEVGIEGLVTADNVDITRKLRIRRRKGQTLSSSAASDSAYISDGAGMRTSGTNLIFIDSDFTETTIRSDLTAGGQIVFYRFGSQFYYSNGFESGVYDNGVDRTLGLLRPDDGPIVSNGSGDLGAGRILVCCSYVREDGQESGLSPTKLLETQSGGVNFSGIPVSVDPTVEYVRIYLSHPDGDVLYRALQVVNGVTTASFGGHQSFLVVPERTQYMTKPPAFQDIDQHNSRMVFADRHFLHYSEPFAYELIDPRHNWYALGGRITVLGSVPNGLFVATDNATWYLAGSDLKEASLRKVADYGAIPYTRRYINANVLGGDLGDTPLPLWTSQSGFVIGSAGGQLINVSEKDFTLPSGVTGTAMYRKENGQNHYIAVIKS